MTKIAKISREVEEVLNQVYPTLRNYPRRETYGTTTRVGLLIGI